MSSDDEDDPYNFVQQWQKCITAARKCRLETLERSVTPEPGKTSPATAHSLQVPGPAGNVIDLSNESPDVADSDGDVIVVESSPFPARRRGRRGMSPGRGRGRGRKRGQGISQGRKRRKTPIITVEDEEPSPAPFSSNNRAAEQLNLEEANQTQVIKILWQSLKLVKLSLRKYQDFTSIYEHFSKKFNVSQDRLVFMLDNAILSPSDSPHSLKLTPASIIEGGITDNIYRSGQKAPKNLLDFKILLEDRRKPLIISISGDDVMEALMMKCYEMLGVPIGQLKFFFDGDLIGAQQTPAELEMEGGECIDVFKK